MNSFNDECSDFVKVTDFETLKEFASKDLSEEGECLWHLCETRGGGDNNYAWTGIDEGNWGHYVNNMDDNLISPPINLTEHTMGAALNFTTWYEFYDNGDYGELYVRNASSEPWTLLTEFYTSENKIAGDSGGFFEIRTYYIMPDYCSHTTQFRFRMKSDSDGVSEGWYVDDVEVKDILGFVAPFSYAWISYNTGYADNAMRWTSLEPISIAIELTDPELAPYRGEVIDQVKFACGADAYYFMACDYEIYIVDGSITGLDPTTLTPDGTGVASDTSWTTHTLTTFHPIPATGSVFVIVRYPSYSAPNDFPAGFDMTAPYDSRGDWIINSGTTSTWVNYGEMWCIDAGIASGGPSGDLDFGPVMFFDNFEFKLNHLGNNNWELDDEILRAGIAPWTCEYSIAGNYWKHYMTSSGYLPDGATADCDGDDDWWAIHGYPGTDIGLNNVLYAPVDLTGIEVYEDVDEIVFAALSFCMAWNVEPEVEMFIEISANWDGSSPMSDAVWVPYWHFPDGKNTENSGGWVHSDDLVEDPSNRWNMQQYLGQKIYIRWRFVTPGEGFLTIPDHGLAVDGLKMEYKTVKFVDTEAPITSIFFNQQTAEVTLVAVDYPLEKNSGVKATYYKIDGGETMTYTMPFKLPEGSSTVTYWSEDNANNVESQKSSNYVVDTSAPEMGEFTEPQAGALYLFGNFLMNRILSDQTLCIGKVPVAVTATDSGTGVAIVYFSFSDGQNAFDNTAGDGFTTTWKGRLFGDLTITAHAMDNTGLESGEISTTVTVYSLGLF
jgi:hypothetical protein